MQEKQCHIQELEKGECNNQKIVIADMFQDPPLIEKLLIVRYERERIEKGRGHELHQEHVADEDERTFFNDNPSHGPMVSQTCDLGAFDRECESTGSGVFAHSMGQ